MQALRATLLFIWLAFKMSISLFFFSLSLSFSFSFSFAYFIKISHFIIMIITLKCFCYDKHHTHTQFVYSVALRSNGNSWPLAPWVNRIIRKHSHIVYKVTKNEWALRSIRGKPCLTRMYWTNSVATTEINIWNVLIHNRNHFLFMRSFFSIVFHWRWRDAGVKCECTKPRWPPQNYR